MSTTDKPQALASHVRYVRIRQALLARGITFAHIAEGLKVTPGAITNVAKGRRVSRRIRKALARSAGIPIRELWEDTR